MRPLQGLGKGAVNETERLAKQAEELARDKRMEEISNRIAAVVLVLTWWFVLWIVRWVAEP